MLRNTLAEKGFEVHDEVELADNLIPTHSHLLGAWVEAGAVGAAFWVVICVIAILAIYGCLKRPGRPGVFLGFMLFNLLWDVLFSPFANAQRFVKAAQICMAIWVLQNAESGKVGPASRKRRS